MGPDRHPMHTIEQLLQECQLEPHWTDVDLKECNDDAREFINKWMMQYDNEGFKLVLTKLAFMLSEQ